MERLAERIAAAKNALLAFKEGLDAPTTTLNRDATIQRFEFTLEAAWKLAQLHLRQQEGLDIASPKGVMRACFQSGLLNEEELATAIDMVDARNLTVHTYNESLAIQIFSHLPAYFVLLTQLVDKIDLLSVD